MSKIAVIKTGGKQYKVKEGQNLKVEKLAVPKSGKVKFDTLMVASSDGKTVNLGKPSLGEKVEGEALGEGRGKKISVIKYKNKTRYRRNIGHRQQFTEVKIVAIA